MKDTKTIVLKYGGNAMTNKVLQKEILSQVALLSRQGHKVIVVHGGGPFIQRALDRANIASKFIDGQRYTSTEAISVVEQALKGEVNGELVALLNSLGQKAVGLSGKDGKMVSVQKRWHVSAENPNERVDLGQVGDIVSVDTSLLKMLLDKGYLPVMTCLASDDEGHSYNINADVFAGHIAGALKADEFWVLTDVDGLMKDKDKPDTLIAQLSTSEFEQLKVDKVVVGGMIPKLEACQLAVESGAKQARILNGTKPNQLQQVVNQEEIGTTIRI